ncbi:hypothetical protein FQN51_005305 [Onygenales sp. PD_10]|nr:hypothetical protein FQN51_005305 [Onygenales sp. PD_10]
MPVLLASGPASRAVQMTCGKCEDAPGVIECSCEEIFCERCYERHVARVPGHRKVDSTLEWAWRWIKGSLVAGQQAADAHMEDESAKWFGLVVEKSFNEAAPLSPIYFGGLTLSQPPPRPSRPALVARIVETKRFVTLASESIHCSRASPRRQFPSLVSFVGETGSGKSTIIRALIDHSARSIGNTPDQYEAPVPGVSTGSAAFSSTTGEVNLYADPKTFGRESPIFYADCEGLRGAEPTSSRHQHEWQRHGRRYLVETPDGASVDRTTAVKNIYPKFLYLFSDVICLVSRNPKTRTEVAIDLLEWSEIGADNAVNQSALPAAVIIFNQPSVEDDRWVSADREEINNDFFKSIDEELELNNTLREKAREKGETSLKALLLRNFSSIYIHYIPLKGFGRLGSLEIVYRQFERLSSLIQVESKRLQNARQEAWIRFDSRQINVAFDYAFKHLSKDKNKPFDFSKCRTRTDVPESLESHISQFLSYSRITAGDANMKYAVDAIGSAFVRNELKETGTGFLLNPSTVFNPGLKKHCATAIQSFAHLNVTCAYVHSETQDRCANTQLGHARGHQKSDGTFLAEGSFDGGGFDSSDFVSQIEQKVSTMLWDLHTNHPDDETRMAYATECHKKSLVPTPAMVNPAEYLPGVLSHASSEFTNTCFVCLFGRPECQLPCGQLVCMDCIQDFGSSDPSSPDVITHASCPLCGVKEPTSSWPWKICVKPKLAGTRILSLDGGGVRGIVELEILQRLEDAIGLAVPLWCFFDLIVGTSAGGLIALGMGSHCWSADSCIKKFMDLCATSFIPKTLTKSKYLGKFARLFRSSIYKTGPLEDSLNQAFAHQDMFGLRPPNHFPLRHCPRVAVTATVESRPKLFANYNCGIDQSGIYLNSRLPTVTAARCTSAAPLYFEAPCPASIGTECLDGGLRDNNPINTALSENKKIWGNKTPVDMVLSVGSGRSNRTTARTASPLMRITPSWARDCFSAFIATMNGEDAWDLYCRTQAQPAILSRSRRLNVKFSDQEPQLDDVDRIYEMQRFARGYQFVTDKRRDNYRPMVNGPVTDGILEIALSLRASLFYFELNSVEFMDQNTVAVIEGTIHCRLDPGMAALGTLVSMTPGFRVQGAWKTTPSLPIGGKFRLGVSLQIDYRHIGDAVNIEALFVEGVYAQISGFPRSLKKQIRSALPKYDNISQ